jgi:tRNA modification GTPase
MDLQLDETIAAVASAPGGGARAIVRVSGSAVLDTLSRCVRLNRRDIAAVFAELSRPTVLVGSVMSADLGQPVPCDVYVWPTSRSYTREPLAELHLPGSTPLATAVLDEICRCGARVARPGEFTMRAFLAGRIDLTQAEAVLGVIDANERRGLDVALAQLAGGLSGPLHELRDELIDLLARLEAGLDFADEDIEFISRDEIHRQLGHAATIVADLQQAMRTRGRSDTLARVVLRGMPNVGKSSLFNALAGDAPAITSGVAGTTRDYLTATIELEVVARKLGGVACQLIDTAGVGAGGEKATSEEEDTVDRAARTMAGAQSDAAHIELFCLDVTRPLDDWEREQLAVDAAVPRLVVLTKSDRPRRTDYTDADVSSPTAVVTSSHTGEGIESLRQELRHLISDDTTEAATAVASTAARCAESLRLAGESLARANTLTAREGEELVAAEIRVALDELGKVVGAVYTDDVLDRIFSQFCIGK